MAKNKFNHSWLHDHINDPYVKLAQKHGYRARAAFKLREIDDADRLIRPGSVVVDLGATPGSWSQVVRERMKKGSAFSGRIIALDLLPMEPIEDVDFFQGDFREDDVLAQLEARLADLVASSTLCFPTWPPTSPESGWRTRRGCSTSSNWRATSRSGS